MTRVTVVGRGVVGLTTAIVLAERGHEVVCLGMESRVPSSESSCALFLPYFGTGSSHDAVRWATRGFKQFSMLEHDGETGVSRIRMVECFRGEVVPPGSLTSDIEVLAGWRTDLPSPFTYAWEFETFLVDMSRYFNYLETRCVTLGVTLMNGQWPASNLVPRTEVVVNCAGHWAREFDSGLDIEPVRGQIIVVSGFAGDVAVGGDEYMIAPRSDGCIVGSLWQVGVEEADPSEADAEALLAVLDEWRGAPLLASIAAGSASLSKVLAGVRPFRAEGPVVAYREDVHPPMIHNVGHGGSGVALSWGCAEDVAAIVGGLA